MASWELLLWIIFAIVMAGVTVFGVGVIAYIRRENSSYLAEQILWLSLVHTGQPADGVIRSLRLHSDNLSRGGSHGQSMCAVVLEVDYTDASGARRTAAIRTYIEETLLAVFQEPLKVIHLLYDPAHPASVVIDRGRSPLELARGS